MFAGALPSPPSSSRLQPSELQGLLRSPAAARRRRRVPAGSGAGTGVPRSQPRPPPKTKKDLPEKHQTQDGRTDAAPFCWFMRVSGTASKTPWHRGVPFVTDARGDTSVRRDPPTAPSRRETPRRNLNPPFCGDKQLLWWHPGCHQTWRRRMGCLVPSGWVSRCCGGQDTHGARRQRAGPRAVQELRHLPALLHVSQPGNHARPWRHRRRPPRRSLPRRCRPPGGSAPPSCCAAPCRS